MDNEKLVPKLRFSGFDYEWNSQKFKDNLDIKSGKGFKASEYTNSGIPLIKIDNVSYGKITWETRDYLPNEYLVTYPELILRKNDVVLALNRPITNNKLKIAKLSDKDELSILYQRVGKIFIDENNLDREFVFHLLNKEIFKFVLKNSVGSDQPFISTNKLKELELKIPSLKEQQKIGNFLYLINYKLELLENKHKLYLDFKKYLMQQIFAQNLRFDFTYDWKKTKLGKITQINTGNKDVKDKVDNGEYPFFVRSENIERINSYSYDGEAILIPGDGKIGEVYHYINGKFDYHQRVYKISDFKSNVDGKYIYYYLEKNFLRQALKNTAKATVDSLRRDTLTKMPIELPSLEEQLKIADVLSIADDKIKLVEKDIKIIKDFKRGLLQQMFV